MGDRPDLDRYVEEEYAKALARPGFARFRSWPLALRLVVAVGGASLFLGVSTLVTLRLFSQTDDDAAWWSALIASCLVAFLIYVMAIRYAISPDRAVRLAARNLAEYPTSAPGYSTWRGDEPTSDISRRRG